MLINYYEGNRLPFFLLRSSSIFIGTFIALVLKQIQIFIKGNVILNMKCSMYLLIIKSLTQIYQNGSFYIIQFCFKITEILKKPAMNEQQYVFLYVFINVPLDLSIRWHSAKAYAARDDIFSNQRCQKTLFWWSVPYY